MIHDLKPYPAMKDSGVPWLGQVPEHWSIKRLGSVLKERGEVNKNRQVAEVLSVIKDVGVIPYADKGNVGNKKSDDIKRYKIVRPDDLVMNSMNVIIGSVGRSKYTGCLSQVYYALERRQIENDPRYIELVFKNRAVQHSLTRIGNGILAHRMRIPMELLKSEPFLLPPPEEQAAIVRFLDHADRRIRNAIAAKQKLIRLLQEQKQAIIHQAVTRGLNPNVKLKPSGVEWLGDVPEGWAVMRLKEVITPIKQGWSPQCDAQPAGEGEWGVVKVGCVNSGEFNSSQNKKLPETLQPISELEIVDGDILVSRANTRELVGLAALAIHPRPRLLLCDKVFRFRATSQLDSHFAVLAIRGASSRAQIESSTSGASDSMQNIGQAVIRNLIVSLPSLAEQKDIVMRIEVETEQINQTITRVQQEVLFLREYRTRLIADVVTGKLDVREVAVDLSELTEDASLADIDAEEADSDELEGVEAEETAEA